MAWLSTADEGAMSHLEAPLAVAALPSRGAKSLDTRMGPSALIWKFCSRLKAFTRDSAVSACMHRHLLL